MVLGRIAKGPGGRRHKAITVIPRKLLGMHLGDPYATGTCLIHWQADLYYGNLAYAGPRDIIQSHVVYRSPDSIACLMLQGT